MPVIAPHTRIVALDIETTGLSAARHRILEVAAVRWCDGRETAHFEALIDPRCAVPQRVIAVHGITTEMVCGKPTAAEVLPEFFRFCHDADVLVAHNAPFDTNFLNVECSRIGIPPFTRTVTDSCALARVRWPRSPNYRLETLKCALGLGRGQSHRALADARDCLALYLRCMQEEVPPLRLPLDPPSLPPNLQPLSEALTAGEDVVIEYQDTRGRRTKRAVRPLFIDERTMVAFCLLRNERRHFALDRILRIL